jgi:UDP-N-acetylmuramyl pentapeptide phosphotransferase/UDP-N-acetylglucosamine-1-phosphate transferase
MDNILLSTALAFLITFFSIPVIIQVAKVKKLFDEPDERKVHKTVIPTLGGLGIFAGFILATLLCTPPNLAGQLQFFAAASVVIFFLGLKDDILVISATKKFIGQLIAAGIIIKFGNIHITNMGGFMGIHEIPRFAGTLFTIFTIIVITNSFNLIDGVDGLAGSLGLLTTLIFGVYFYMSGELAFSVMAFSLSGSIVSFLIYNFSPAKIFMGDTGSLLIGLINSILVIKFINVAGNPAGTIALNAAPAIGFSILMIPLFDTLRVFGLRILARRSPFSPDRNHVHHFLLDLGFNHRQVTFTCVVINIGFIAMAFSLRSLGTSIVLSILLFTGLSFIGFIYYLRKKMKQTTVEQVKNQQIIKRHKVLSLIPEAVEVE